jgi:DNA-binding CsgD family transcriptional regulator
MPGLPLDLLADGPAPGAAGLGAVALRVYEALVARPGTPAQTLGEPLGLDPERVVAAVEELRVAGLVEGPAHAPVAVPPEVAAEALLALHYSRLADESSRVVRIRRHLAEMVDHQQYEDGPSLEVVRGLPAIQARLANLTQRSRSEVLCMVPSATRTLATTSEPLMATNLDAAERGVRMRTLVPNAVADDPDGWAYARALAEMGDDVRTCPSIALVANIFDRRTAMVPLDSGNTRSAGVVVTNETLVAGLVALFEQMWGATAMPIAALPPAEALGDRDRQVLELLLRGAKDEQVARTLGVSVRTVRWHVASLTTRAGARSRFQLAAVALQRGWISTD